MTKLCCFLACLTFAGVAGVSAASEPDANPRPIADVSEALLSPTVIDVSTRTVLVMGHGSQRKVPRFFATLGSATVQDHPQIAVEVHPEIDHWVLTLPEAHARETAVLVFESTPLTTAENVVTRPIADGTVRLRACHGRVSGAKLRFEPQPHKNTIGYWVDPNAKVQWDFIIDRAGKYNLGVLYGCGEGQGGVAKLSFQQGEASVSHSVDAEPTGHFQNFLWHPSGDISFPSAGRWTLTVAAEEIHNQALTDIREIELSIHRP